MKRFMKILLIIVAFFVVISGLLMFLLFHVFLNNAQRPDLRQEVIVELENEEIYPIGYRYEIFNNNIPYQV